MFGDRGPLYQEVEDGAGGGLPLNAQGDPVRQRRGGMSGAVKDPGLAPMTEPEELLPTKPGWDAGGEDDDQGRLPVKDPQSLGSRKGPKSPWTGKVSLNSLAAPDTSAAIGAREYRINQAERLQHLVDMRTAGFTRDQMTRWANLNDQDAEVAGEMMRTNMPRIQQKIQGLQQKVNDALALKVDPYNWHNSIGRGGRVSAAFAAMTGGFAAGKQNPNSAIAMLDAAIERDITAQRANIQKDIQLLSQGRQLAEDEKQLINDQLAQMSEIRAVKYAGIVGRIKAAQQHAVTEAHHLALQTSADHYELKYLHAKAAAEAEAIRLEFEGPIKNAEQIAKLKADAALYQSMIRTGPSGGMTVPTEAVQTLEGDIAGARPEAQIMMAPQAPAPGRARAVGGRRQGSATTLAGGGSGGGERQGQAAASVPPGAVSQDAEGNYLDAEGNVLAPQEQAAPKAQRSGQVVNSSNIARFAQTEGVDAHPKAIQKGSYARATATGSGGQDVNVGMTTWSEALDDIAAGRPIRNGGMADHRDAKVIKAALAENGPPDPNQYKAPEASEKFGDGRIPTPEDNIHYQKALEMYEHTQKYPSVLERSTYDAETGEKSKIKINGRMFTILPGSRSGKDYERIQEEVSKYRSTLSSLRTASQTIQRVGLSGMWTTDASGNTSFSIPGMFSNPDPDVLRLQRDAITQAMVYIKTHDPTARISDKDLEVGQKAAANYTGDGAKFVDWLQSMFNVSTKRDQITAFMGKVVIEAQRIMYEKLEDDIVPDYNTRMELERQYKANDKFVREASQRE